jgi:hypothetical protein
MGAFAAIASWVYAYDLLYSWLSHIHQDIGMAVTAAVIAGVLAYRVLQKRRAGRKDAGG